MSCQILYNIVCIKYIVMQYYTFTLYQKVLLLLRVECPFDSKKESFLKESFEKY